MSNIDETEMSRRRFLGASAAGLAAAGLPLWFADRAQAQTGPYRAGRRIGPNDTINIGAIGLGGSRGGYRQGLSDTRGIGGHPGVKVVAVCDVDELHLNEAAQIFGPDCAKFVDYRDLLARPDIDAVVIGTPDHWHCAIAAAALHAGKDVYCEKPLTLTIDEGKRLVKVWRDSKRVFQVGSQQRSDGRFRMACELVRNGRIGTLKTINANLPGGGAGGPFQPEPVPQGLHWDLWLGPAPFAEYTTHRCHGDFRWWLEYSGGALTDWGAHHNDIAQWAMGTDRSGPISVQGYAKGPYIGENCYNVFPEFDIYYTYAGGVQLHTSNKNQNGVEFIGDKGTIFVSRDTIHASDQKLLDEPLPAGSVALYVSNDHHGNFVDCVRNRKQPICDAEIGHRSATTCHLANISLRLGGRKLNWDPLKEQFVNDKEADSYLARARRANWPAVR